MLYMHILKLALRFAEGLALVCFVMVIISDRFCKWFTLILHGGFSDSSSHTDCLCANVVTLTGFNNSIGLIALDMGAIRFSVTCCLRNNLNISKLITIFTSLVNVWSWQLPFRVGQYDFSGYSTLNNMGKLIALINMNWWYLWQSSEFPIWWHLQDLLHVMILLCSNQGPVSI